MSLPKKIAVLCNYRLTPERVGGMDRFFWLYDKKCKENGYDVVWFMPNNQIHGAYSEMNIVSSDNEELDSFFLKYTKSNAVFFSHVITHFLELCTPFFKNIKLEFAAKIIVVDHNSRPLEGFPFKKKLSKKIRGLLYSRYIDTFVGVSEYTIKHIKNDYGNFLDKKIKLVYNGIDCDVFLKNTNRKTEKPRFIVTSNLRYIKGIQDLITAVAILPENIKNEMCIDLYGEGDYEEALKTKVKSLSLEKNFAFKGSSSKLNEIYCHYDYMIQPTYMECFSLTILESLASNVPVITTPVGGNLEVIKDGVNGYVFDVKDAEKLSSILMKLYLGHISIKNTTFELIEKNFTISQMVQNHIDLL